MAMTEQHKQQAPAEVEDSGWFGTFGGKMVVGRILRKMDFAVRRFFESRQVSIAPEEIAQLNFYQFKTSTAEFFYKRFYRTTIKVLDTPHFAFASALTQGRAKDIAAAEEYYKDYLLSSWGRDKLSSINKRVQEFRATFECYRRVGIREKPILTNLPTDKQGYVVDGNHRTAIAAALNMRINATIWPASLAFSKFSRVPGFYGTDVKNEPYQTIILHGSEVIRGRRIDLERRLLMIPPHVIQGNSILDVACNAGMSALLAYSLGARKCVGIEVSPKLVDLASRFAMFSGVFPSVTYRCLDIDEEDLNDGEVYDTAFFFSIYSHLRDPYRLVSMARKNVRHFVVFEGHPGRRENDYAKFFYSGVFKNVIELGRLDTSRYKQDRARVLWLCEK